MTIRKWLRRIGIGVAIIGSLGSIYVLSFGPACWWYARPRGMHPAVPEVYWPFGEAAKESDGGDVYRLITWYALLRRSEETIVIPVDDRAYEWLPLMRSGLPKHD